MRKHTFYRHRTLYVLQNLKGMFVCGHEKKRWFSKKFHEATVYEDKRGASIAIPFMRTKLNDTSITLVPCLVTLGDVEL